ncbi:alpha-hydroxy-acid oxidizing protein [Vreelandella nanhaiensis]|uniref:alpha-hydroxy-acid oxidizing protein n=1 Tax=Vreelandella nanhaiensis TaxID=1258546 RepID=UPI00163C4D54|nr:alpha-hydroxy-acid oxidizing protein [Halomonas nanhaiensis]
MGRIAKKKLPNFVFEYVDGGSDDEHTLRRNRAVFVQYLFEPKIMTNVDTQNFLIAAFGVAPISSKP